MKGPIVFRVEAGPKIGGGHLMRCLALAQAHADRGGSAIFVTTGEAPRFEDRLGEEGFDVVHVDVTPGSPGDASRTLQAAEHARASFVVADGYAFGIAYHKKLRSSGIPLAVLDDGIEQRVHCADIVINQNLHARDADYLDRAAHTKLLMGPSYALLRREFLRFSKWRRKVPKAGKRLLVTLGASDPENVTEGLLRALLACTAVEATVIIGGANPRREQLEALAFTAGSNVQLRVDVRSMAALMARSDAAISSGGSTVWELAFMGLPSIVGAANAGEELVLGGLEKHELFVPMGRFSAIGGDGVLRRAMELLEDAAERASMSTRARKIVDGLGASRVLDAIETITAAKALGRQEAGGSPGRM